MLPIPKTTENHEFEMAHGSTDNKELLQMWYQLDGRAQPPCYRLQPTASNNSRFKISNKIMFSSKIEITLNNSENASEVKVVNLY
jgi:hypothetical protein